MGTNTMNARTTACILLVAAVAVLPGVVAQDEACTPLSDVVAAQNLTTLGAVVQAVSANDPDLGSTLEAALGSESGNLTVFGPTDEAFAAALTALNTDAATLLGGKHRHRHHH